MTAGLSDDVIAAVATPPGQGGIGVVRLSGRAAKGIASQLCSKDLLTRQAVYCEFAFRSQRIDQGLALYFPAPHSFTGEEVVELHAHGSPVVLQLLLDAAVELGARLARPGEFSERAFANGKIDLVQAEAIADLIASGSAQAARAALNSLQGEFSREVNAVAKDLEQLRVYVEAAIDFPDEEVELLSNPEVANKLGAIDSKLARLISQSRQGQRLNQGLTLVILGAPNAGKSSLLNVLARETAAIVSDVPGTTRDLLKVDLLLNGVPVRIIDTAGLRSEADQIEQIGIERAREQARAADLLLLVTDAHCYDADTLADHVGYVLSQADVCAADQPVLVVANKKDLVTEPFESPLQFPLVWISATTGEGVDELRTRALQAVGYSPLEAPFTARARHVQSLRDTQAALVSATDAIEQGLGAELSAEELRQAHLHLGEIVGVVTADDLLGKIFSEFCIGK